MDVYPAIDLREGVAVRLLRGDFALATEYGDPLALAEAYAAAGTRWIHVVDLDAARSGEPVNRELVLAIARRVGARVQAGGGVRSAADADELLSGGVARVVLGTAALEDPGLLGDLARARPGQVALGLDYRRRDDGELEAAWHGWERGAGRTVTEVLKESGTVPLGAVVATAIDRDGTLSGPDLDGLAVVLDATTAPVVASGGVGAAADLAALYALRGPGTGRRPDGVIVGRALLDGRLTMEEAMAQCAPSG